MWDSPSGAAERAAKTRFQTFARCPQASPPVLPSRWHAVALMAPFRDEQLDVAELTYDDALPALRATVYGVKAGAIDLLITPHETFALTGPASAPTGCASLGPQFTPSSRQWLSDKAECAGVAPVMASAAEWWKMPAQDSASTYFWFTARTRLPLRAMLTASAREPAVIGGYAMSYFSTFEPIARTNLAALGEFCRAHASGEHVDVAARQPDVRALMAKVANPAGETERAERVATLFRGCAMTHARTRRRSAGRSASPRPRS